MTDNAFRLTNVGVILSEAKNLNYSDIQNHWAKSEILQITALDYMDGHGDKFFPNRHLNYGEALTTAIKAVGKEGEAQKLSPNNHQKGIYQIAYNMELIPKPEDQDKLIPAPNKKVTREEAANILARALEIDPPMGHEIQEAKKFTDYKKIADHRLPYVELALQKGYISGRNKNIFDPKAYITRGEFAKIISNANEDLLPYRNIVKKSGQVSNIELGNITIYNTDTTSNIIGYKGKDSFSVQKDKKIYNGDIIKTGNFLTYYMDHNGKVIYAEIGNKKTKTVEGTIREINLDQREITVWDYNDKHHKFKIDPYIPIEELYFEQEVEITTQGDKVLKMATFSPIDPERDGYIIPGTRFRVGTVLFANNSEIEIKTSTGREKFQIDENTTLFKRGQRVELFQLKEGDRVLLSFDDIYSSKISEIKIEDEEKHIGGVIKGKIELIDERNKEILINEVYELNQGQWRGRNSKERIKLGTGSIYEGGKKITLKNLNKRKKEEIYIAYENAYGNTSISKALMKSGSAMEHKDKIQNIDYGTGQMVVSTTSFGFHEGTIVVKDNRLVDSLNINTSQNVYLVSDYRNGNRTASVVSIEDTGILDDRIDGSKLLVYKGKIEDIFNYKLTLGKYNYKLDKEVLTNSGFKSNPGTEELNLSLDTYIYDSELQKQIPTNAFLDSRYIDLIDIKDRELRNRIEKDHYKNKPAYIVARETSYGKEILSINLIPQDLNKYNDTVKLDNSILGEINTINQENNSININKVKVYNNLTKRWEYTENKDLNLNKAIILVNDKPLSLEELYKIRPGSKAYIVNHNDTAKDMPYILIIEN
ncbi:MAG: S-layer homology domain-containing protein [Tissierellia bacterium]|nr:S-layer homology domain-containing protein [Tissierellia bacterium]